MPAKMNGYACYTSIFLILLFQLESFSNMLSLIDFLAFFTHIPKHCFSVKFLSTLDGKTLQLILFVHKFSQINTNCRGFPRRFARFPGEAISFFASNATISIQNPAARTRSAPFKTSASFPRFSAPHAASLRAAPYAVSLRTALYAPQAPFTPERPLTSATPTH